MTGAEFYFDYLSPYAYLASLRVERVCGAHDVQVRFRPVLFAGLLNHWGQRGPAEIAPKAMHTFRECLRYAVLHEIPFRSPRYHPFRSLIPLRMTLAVPEERRADVVHAFFDHGWGQGGDLGNADELASLLDGLGLAGSEIRRSSEGDGIKQRLREETQAAIERGVFGIPTLELRGELFWGLDQLPTVDRVLQGADPLRGVELAGRGPEGRSAWRRQVPVEAGVSAPIELAVHVAPFEAELIRALEVCVHECFPDAQTGYLDERLKELDSPALVGAFRDGQLVGFKLGYRRRAQEFYSWLGGVRPAFRRRGLASQLMARQHEWCAGQGYGLVTTEALSDNAEMLRLDLRHGFQIVGTRLDDRGLKVLMERQLRS